MNKGFMFIWLISTQIHAAAPEAHNRLSWGPYEFLRKGFRSAPWEVRDPFYPETKLNVVGVVSGEMALINGKWLRIGEKVEGYTIKEISKEGVTLMRHAEIVLLKLRENP